MSPSHLACTRISRAAPSLVRLRRLEMPPPLLTLLPQTAPPGAPIASQKVAVSPLSPLLVNSNSLPNAYEATIEFAQSSPANHAATSTSAATEPDGRFHCPDCCSDYSRRDHLKRHVETKHGPNAGTFPLVCTQCDCASGRTDKLLAHERRHL